MTNWNQINSQMNRPIEWVVERILKSKAPLHLLFGLVSGVLTFIWLSFSSNEILFGLFGFQSVVAGMFIGTISTIILNPSSQPDWKLVFACVILLCLFWIPLGFDVTDEGRRLSVSYYLFGPTNSSLVNFKFGSSLINYLWLHLFPTPNILWSRLGFALVQAGVGAVSFKLLKIYFPNRISFLMSVAASGIALVYVVQTINYNNFSVLLILATIFFLLKDSATKKHWFISGVLIGFAAISKLTLIILVPVGLGYILYKKSIRGGMFFVAGLVMILSGFMVYLAASGNFAHYTDQITDFVVEPYIQGEVLSNNLEVHKHDPDTLSRLYSKNLGYLLDRTWPVAISILLIGLTTVGRNYWLWGLSFLITLVIWHRWMSNDYYYYFYIGITLTVAIIAFASSRKKEEIPLLISAVILCLVSFVGSNTGIRNMVTSGAIVLPLAFGLCSMFTSERIPTIGRATSTIIALALFILAFNYKNHTIYRDGMRSELTSTFSSSALLGIHSTASRVKTTDELAGFAKKEDLKGTLLCLNTIPMFHYTLGLSPGVKIYWRMTKKSENEKEVFLKSDEAPELILSSKVNVRDANWPQTTEVTPPADKDYLAFYTSLLDDPNGPYGLIFDNGVFALYQKRQ